MSDIADRLQERLGDLWERRDIFHDWMWFERTEYPEVGDDWSFAEYRLDVDLRNMTAHPSVRITSRIGETTQTDISLICLTDPVWREAIPIVLEVMS